MRLFRRPSLRILLVCKANVCRSPMAEGLLRKMVVQAGFQLEIAVDSAGTHVAQPGRRADSRAQQVCRAEGIDIHSSRARQVKEADFARFDYILAMDGSTMHWLYSNSPEPCHSRICLLGEWGEAEGKLREIPDPYYGSFAGFESVLSMLQAPLRRFLEDVGASISGT